MDKLILLLPHLQQLSHYAITSEQCYENVADMPGNFSEVEQKIKHKNDVEHKNALRNLAQQRNESSLKHDIL